MNQQEQVNGIVISAMPMGEYDRRVLLLTAQLGKISAFIRGGRRINSPLLNAGRLFSYGIFQLFPGRSAWTVQAAEVQESFDFLTSDPEAMCYASYFAELAAYYGRENVEDYNLLKLLFMAIHALSNPKLNRLLIRYAYELKLMQVEGEALEEPPLSVGESAYRAWQYVLSSPLDKCFVFRMEATAYREFSQAVAALRNERIDGHFKTLNVLEEFLALSI